MLIVPRRFIIEDETWKRGDETRTIDDVKWMIKEGSFMSGDEKVMGDVIMTADAIMIVDGTMKVEEETMMVDVIMTTVEDNIVHIILLFV